MRRPFPIMLIKLVFYNPSNFRFTPKNAQIMLDCQNNPTLVAEMLCFISSKTYKLRHPVYLSSTEQSEKCLVVC